MPDVLEILMWIGYARWSPLRPLNTDLSSAWREAANWDAWRSVWTRLYAQDELSRKKKNKMSFNVLPTVVEHSMQYQVSQNVFYLAGINEETLIPADENIILTERGRPGKQS